jgi:hypothetical protein
MTNEVFASALRKEGFFEKLDLSKVPNYADLYPLAKTTDGYGAIAAVSPIGIGYRTDMIKTPPKSWKDLWTNREFKGQLGMYQIANSAGYMFLMLVSRIYGSVQPYGLVIPRSWKPDSGRRWRLDTWFHGRGEQLSELAFLTDRMRNPGEFTPPDTFVLHLYGRYCNGSRFAGETDFWEALTDVRSRYPIDENRLVVRWFSLGGASAWHFGVHHAARWAAVAPGAGFSETAEFLKVFQKEKLAPAWWEQKLWRLHDATANALNLSMVPTIAYSGADDIQIQAARMMEAGYEHDANVMWHEFSSRDEARYTYTEAQKVFETATTRSWKIF